MHVLFCLCELLFRIKSDEDGAVATEYSFLIVFLAIAAAIGMVTLGTSISDYFDTFGNALSSAGDAVNPS